MAHQIFCKLLVSRRGWVASTILLFSHKELYMNMLFRWFVDGAAFSAFGGGAYSIDCLQTLRKKPANEYSTRQDSYEKQFPFFEFFGAIEQKAYFELTCITSNPPFRDARVRLIDDVLKTYCMRSLNRSVLFD